VGGFPHPLQPPPAPAAGIPPAVGPQPLVLPPSLPDAPPAGPAAPRRQLRRSCVHDRAQAAWTQQHPRLAAWSLPRPRPGRQDPAATAPGRCRAASSSGASRPGHLSVQPPLLPGRRAHRLSVQPPLLLHRSMDTATAATTAAGSNVGVTIGPGTHLPIAPAALSSELAHGGAPYIAGLGPITAASPLPLRRGSPPGFPASAPPTWSYTVAPSALPTTDSALVGTLATIQAAVTASRERERTASLALERERALGAALTTQMATTQRLLGRPTLAAAEPPEDPHTSDLDADLIAALHAQAAGLHNIRALVSVVLDPASSHYPRWRGQVLLTLRRFVLVRIGTHTLIRGWE
jgi:hypothetical protein